MSDFIYEGKCVLCGKQDALNEGICAAHGDEVAQAYLFGIADGKASRDLSELLTPQEKATRARASLESRGIPVWADKALAPLSSEAVGKALAKLEKAKANFTIYFSQNKQVWVGDNKPMWVTAYDHLINALALLTPSSSEDALAHLDSQEQVCPECGGTGKNLSAGPEAGQPCSTCSGTGMAKKGEA